MENRDLLRETPTIPDFVYDKLPDFFKEILRHFQHPRERDIVLLSSTIVVSGCLDGISGRYLKDRVRPPLYGFVIAPAASGKSAAKHPRLIGIPMQRRMVNENVSSLQKYQAALKKWETSKSRQTSPPEKPPLKYLFLPGDTSAASLYDRLYKNGGRGILFETEADVLSGSLKQDWGSFSDGLRKAFHHEAISVSRKTDDTYFIIEMPSIAIFLTGTPDQFKKLIKSPENGLFSRFIYYGYKSDLQWINPKPCDDCVDPTSLFERKGDEMLKVSDWLHDNQVDFRLSDNQFDKLTTHFEGKLDEIRDTESEDEVSIINRLGLICFRLAMIFSVFRQIVPGHKVEVIVCDDQDFENALTLVDTFLEHSRIMLKMLSNDSVNETEIGRMSEFVALLPQEFTKDQANEIGIGKIGLSARTVTNYLNRLRHAGSIDRISYGNYRKKVLSIP